MSDDLVPTFLFYAAYVGAFLALASLAVRARLRRRPDAWVLAIASALFMPGVWLTATQLMR